MNADSSAAERAAALQYVRKVSGMTKPTRGSEAAFERAVTELFDVTKRLLGELPARSEPRTREGEREKAKLRWERRST